MPTWPPITDPQLVHRMAMSDADFVDYLRTYTAALGPREHTPETYARALAYPFARPARSYLLTGDDVCELDRLTRPECDRILDAYTGRDRANDHATARFPLLAIGSNAAPAQLKLKFAHFTGADRDVLVLAGELHDFDVGASAHPTFYGAMPATIFPSPGTRMRAAILWVTAAQFTQLTWTEISYRLGRLEGVRFTGDDVGYEEDGVLVYVSRLGAFHVDGEPVALRAIPAQNRTADALTQEQLLDAAARLTLGPPDDHAEALVRRIFADAGGFVRDHSPAIMAAGRPFASDRWVAYPAPPGDADDDGDTVAPGIDTPG